MLHKLCELLDVALSRESEQRRALSEWLLTERKVQPNTQIVDRASSVNESNTDFARGAFWECSKLVNRKRYEIRNNAEIS